MKTFAVLEDLCVSTSKIIKSNIIISLIMLFLFTWI